MTAKNLKNMPTRTKSVVFGYVREMEKELNLPSTPLMIKYSICSFSRDEDFFIAGHEFIKLTNNNKTMTKYRENGWKQVIKGHQIIDTDLLSNNIAKWKIKIQQNVTRASRFGVLSVWIGLINVGGSDDNTIQCVLHAEKEKEKIFTQGDIVTFILDIKDKTIKYRVNEGPIQILQKLSLRKRNKFRFGANLWNIGNSITMIDFSIDQR